MRKFVTSRYKIGLSGSCLFGSLSFEVFLDLLVFSSLHI